MVNKIKRLNKLQIVSIIGLTISLVLVWFNIKGMTNWFWIFIGLNIYGFVKYMDEWCREGRSYNKEDDKKYSKNLTRYESDRILLYVVAYVLVICILFIAEFWLPDFTREVSTIIGMFIFTIVYDIVLVLIVSKTADKIDYYADSKLVKKK